MAMLAGSGRLQGEERQVEPFLFLLVDRVNGALFGI
jgi:hypothetical protein